MFKKFLPQIIAMLFLAGFIAYAWTEPASPPPGGNVAAPINVGSASQYKSGALGLGGLLRAYSDAIFDGNVSIGTVTIKGDGSISTNLNADKLDNQHASELRPSTGLYGLVATYGRYSCWGQSCNCACQQVLSPATCTPSSLSQWPTALCTVSCPAGYTVIRTAPAQVDQYSYSSDYYSCYKQ